MQRLLSLLIMAALGVTLVACASPPPSGATELEACFQRHPEPNRQTKDWRRIDSERLTVCLRSLSEPEQARVLQAFVTRSFEFKDPHLRQAYWAAMFPELVKAGRWNELRLAFTVYSLNELAFNQPEWWIAHRDVERLDVLCDACQATKGKEIRSQLVRMLRTAFVNGPVESTDEELIKFVRNEVLQRSEDLEANPDYLVRFTSLNTEPVRVPLLRSRLDASDDVWNPVVVQRATSEIEACVTRAPFSMQRKDWHNDATKRMRECIDQLRDGDRDQLVRAFVRNGVAFRERWMTEGLAFAILIRSVESERWDELRTMLVHRGLSDFPYRSVEAMIAGKDVSKLELLCDAAEHGRTQDIRDGCIRQLRLAFMDRSYHFTDRELPGAIRQVLAEEAQWLEPDPEYVPRVSVNNNGGDTPLLRKRLNRDAQ